MAELKTLPEQYKNKGIVFSLLDRTEKAAIYKSNIGTFEVFEVVIAEESTANFGGKVTVVPRREVMPGDEKFGKTAFAFQLEEAARSAYDKMNS